MNTKPIKQKLEAFCEFINGGAWNESEYTDAGIPVLKVSNIKDQAFSLENIDYLSIEGAKKYSKNILNENDLIVATVGSHPSLVNSAAGRTISVPKPLQGYLLNQNAVCIRTKDNEVLFQLYLRYIGETDFFRAYIQARGKGAANQMRIAISEIKNFPINPPALTIQKEIAVILSAYDDLIENNLKRIKLLEEMAQITYEEWFVRLKFPGHETTSIDSETGLPEGWGRKKLGDILSLNYGKSLTAEVRSNGSVPVYGSAGIVGFHNESIVKGPGVIVGRKGNVGSIFWSDDDFYPIDTVFFVSSNLPLLYIRFLLSYIEFVNNDAAVPGLNRNSAYLIKCAIPPTSLIEQFEEFVAPLFQSIRNLNSQNQLLKEARDILLPRLMTGMIDVEQIALPNVLQTGQENLR
ncbi:MAG: restriction endonuclease subunit S [Methylobacter sp.]|nr:restriction endonuclease subunit S [Methylobacter sp.]